MTAVTQDIIAIRTSDVRSVIVRVNSLTAPALSVSTAEVTASVVAMSSQLESYTQTWWRNYTSHGEMIINGSVKWHGS